MIPALGRFVDALRREGVRASPSELLDATRAVAAVDLADRARVRAALRATLAKARREAEIFDRAFERFFAPPSRRAGRGDEQEAGSGRGRARAPRRGESLPRAKPQRESEPEAKGPRRGDPARDPRRPELRRERLLALLRRAREGGPSRPGRLRAVRAARGAAARGTESESDAADPRRRDLSRSRIADDEREIAREVPRLIEALRLRRGRRMRLDRRGRLWASALFRRNLSHGGVPFVLPWRRPRRRRTKVVLLVDVSHSVARAAGYFLWIASEFLRFGRAARVVAFVDRPVDVTAAVAAWGRGRFRPQPPRDRGPGARPRPRRRPGEGIRLGTVSFADLMEAFPGINLEAPSDYGRALHALLDSQLRPAGRDTVLLILGDARTNRFDPLPWTLEEISRRCAAVVWLVPEPLERWGTGDSALAGYLPWVDVVVEAKDLEGLERGIVELLRKL